MGKTRAGKPLSGESVVKTTIARMIETCGDVSGRKRLLEEIFYEAIQAREPTTHDVLQFTLSNIAAMQIALEHVNNTWGQNDIQKPEDEKDIQ